MALNMKPEETPVHSTCPLFKKRNIKSDSRENTRSVWIGSSL